MATLWFLQKIPAHGVVVSSSYSWRKADECIFDSAVVQNSGQKQVRFPISLEIKAVSNVCRLDKITPSRT
jgi:hypothetical protein